MCRGERQRIRSGRRSGARRKIGASALVSQRLFHVRRHTRGDDGSFEWHVLNRHTRRRASKNFKNSAAAEAQRRSYRPPSTAIRGCETMTDLLFQPSPARGPNDYEVIADDWIVGRIVLSDASPAERPWMWSLDHEFYQGRERTYGYEATREAAMQAFARCWHRD